MSSAKATGLFLPPAGGPIRSTIEVPGDKSISHRALLLGAVAAGPLTVTGFLRSADTVSTLAAVQALGVEVHENGDGTELTVQGGGWEGLEEPGDVIDVGNAGTLMRLVPGLLAGSRFLCVLTGDASIRGRPMDRIVRPLTAMGANISGREGGRRAPLAIRGGPLRGIRHTMDVASAQVKSCLLLAGLQADGMTVIAEPGPSRDHTERLLRYLGASVRREGDENGPGEVSVRPSPKLAALDIAVPGDFSSAAFPLVAALLHSDAEITVRGVGLNPTRTGLLDVLTRMGADIEVGGQTGAPAAPDSPHQAGPEPVGHVTARSCSLQAVTIEPDEVPLLLDEIPVWALAAAGARGVSRLKGAAELRIKESDRLAGTASILRALGVRVDEESDGLTIYGAPSGWTGASLRTHADHRLAMMAAVAGIVSAQGVHIDDTNCIDVSFPGFIDTIQSM